MDDLNKDFLKVNLTKDDGSIQAVIIPSSAVTQYRMTLFTADHADVFALNLMTIDGNQYSVDDEPSNSSDSIDDVCFKVGLDRDDLEEDCERLNSSYR